MYHTSDKEMYSLVDRREHVTINYSLSAWQIQIKINKQSIFPGSLGYWFVHPGHKVCTIISDVNMSWYWYPHTATLSCQGRKIKHWKHNLDRQAELLTRVFPGVWQGEAVRNKQQESRCETERTQLHGTLSQHSSMSLWRCDHVITASLQSCSL